MITYDLRGADETSADYADLIKQIKDYPAWAKIALSAWVVRTTSSTADVRDALARHLDANDRLFVAELTGTAAWRNVICRDSWLQDNL